MDFTDYFLSNRSRPDRQLIQEDWIRRVIDNPVRRQLQSDGRIRLWGRIEEYEGRYLRVVLLRDGKTVHNAFFDRRFKEPDDET